MSSRCDPRIISHPSPRFDPAPGRRSAPRRGISPRRPECKTNPLSPQPTTPKTFPAIVRRTLMGWARLAPRRRGTNPTGVESPSREPFGTRSWGRQRSVTGVDRWRGETGPVTPSPRSTHHAPGDPPSISLDGLGMTTQDQVEFVRHLMPRILASRLFSRSQGRPSFQSLRRISEFPAHRPLPDPNRCGAIPRTLSGGRVSRHGSASEFDRGPPTILRGLANRGNVGAAGPVFDRRLEW